MNTMKLMATTGLVVMTGLGPTYAQMTALGTPEGQVDIVAWPGYIERFETNKAYH